MILLSRKDEPLLIFTTKVSRCANGYHLKIRKKAIFWLGQSGDKRALDTIIEILKTGGN